MIYPKVSIIIPLYVINNRFFDDLKRYKTLNYPNYEIIIICDKKIKISQSRVRFITTGKRKTGPAEKRDLAIEHAKGQICAFIDDDAYPDPSWLKNAIPHFKNKKIAAVGGPGLTPSEDPFWAQVTGVVYKSIFCGGRIQHRFVRHSKKLYVQDYPAYNLLIRKDILKKVGGYGNYFYGGEDTFLCLKIIKEGSKILYDPSVIVYHHRRPLLIPYLKQIANVGIHRGYFAKRYPETSRSLTYFWPTILTFGFITGLIVSALNTLLLPFFVYLLVFFYLIAILSVVNKASFVMSLIAGLGIILTHLTYGIFFVKGLLTKKLLR